MRKTWTAEARNEAGEVVRCRTRKLDVAIHRQRSGGAAGGYSWSKAWYFPKMVNGRLERFPLGHDLTEAVRLADEIAAFLMVPSHTLAEAKRRYNPRALARQSEFSTVGELFDFHRTHFGVLEVDVRTGRRYQVCLVNILRQVEAWRKGTPIVPLRRSGDEKGKEWARWMQRSLTTLDAKLLEDYQTLMVGGDQTERDEEEILTAKITCDSNIRNARAIFSREARLLYANSDLALPDLTKFMGVTLFNAKKYFELLPGRVIRRLFEDSLELKLTDLNAYRAFLAATQCGLRRFEVAGLQMDWFEDEKQPVLKLREDGEFKPKLGHGRTVSVHPWVFAEMQAVAHSREFYLSGTATERNDTVFERLIDWLQKRDVTATKPMHELRKLWFSYKVKAEGILAAQQQGGHTDPKTTSDFYADNQLPGELLPFWQKTTAEALKGAA